VGEDWRFASIIVQISKWDPCWAFLALLLALTCCAAAGFGVRDHLYLREVCNIL
jgi:hypothetical protein